MWPLVAGVLLAYLLFGDNRKKVFISYDHSEDVHLRNLLQAWNRNPRFSFSIHRTSPMKRIESDDEAQVKRALTPMLKQAEYLLVIVGERTHTSRFVAWEIERAMAEDVNLKIAAVKSHAHHKLPAPLLGKDVSWVTTFSPQSVLDALDNARRLH